MSLRFGMLLPGPFFVSAGGSSTKQPSSDLEAKSADYDRGIAAALKLFTRRSYLRELDVSQTELEEYGRGRAASELWDAVTQRTGSHSQGFQDAVEAIRKMNRHYRSSDWEEDAARSEERRTEKRRTNRALRSGNLRFDRTIGCWFYWDGSMWQVWNSKRGGWCAWS